jgi:hypothetical protein
MAWTLAAMPLWVSGFFFILAAFYCAGTRRPGETDGELIWQFVFYLILALIVLCLAAKISS